MSTQEKQSLSASQPVTDVATGNKKTITISEGSFSILEELLHESIGYYEKEVRAAQQIGYDAQSWTDYARCQLGRLHVARNELRELVPVAVSAAHGAVLVTDVRLTRNNENGLCLVAVRSPLVGWFNVIQSSGDEISHCVNLAAVHGAA